MRIALGLEYDGSKLHGWQKQASDRVSTAQSILEDALAKIAATEVRTTVAGRTDAGVHAWEQVVHFDTLASRDLNAWVQGTNSMMPSWIRVLWAHHVGEDFHARFSARARRYYYLLQESVSPMALFRERCHCVVNLSVAHMRRASTFFEGMHDFSSFRAASCQAHNPSRHVHFLRIHKCGAWIYVDIQANGFLQHMVRNIVGSLLEVGQGTRPPEWIKELLAMRDRKHAAPTAPAHALYLSRIRYAPNWGLSHRSAPHLVAPWISANRLNT